MEKFLQPFGLCCCIEIYPQIFLPSSDNITNPIVIEFTLFTQYLSQLNCVTLWCQKTGFQMSNYFGDACVRCRYDGSAGTQGFQHYGRQTFAVTVCRLL